MIQETKDGRRFVEIEPEPYIRVDGSKTHLRRWLGRCRKCGAEFVVKTPASVAPERSSAFGRVHCDAHKGLPVHLRKRAIR